MMIANPDNALHTFKFIPVGNDVATIVIKNVLDNTTYNFTKSQVYLQKYYFVLINASMSLNVNDKLTFEAFNTAGNLVLHDIIFCTDQTVEDYTINKDVYTQRVTTNQFVTNEQ